MLSPGGCCPKNRLQKCGHVFLSCDRVLYRVHYSPVPELTSGQWAIFAYVGCVLECILCSQTSTFGSCIQSLGSLAPPQDDVCTGEPYKEPWFNKSPQFLGWIETPCPCEFFCDHCDHIVDMMNR